MVESYKTVFISRDFADCCVEKIPNLTCKTRIGHPKLQVNKARIECFTHWLQVLDFQFHAIA